MGRIIGIDLGTTNSLVGMWENGQVTLIPNGFGEVLTPSVVSFDEDAKEVYVGKVAKERAVTYPELTFEEFKRFMGTDKVFKAGKRKFSPEELSALVLGKLKKDAEEYLKEPVEEAVISVPAYFDDIARNATKNAGKLAGLKVDRIINEPSAAALAYQQAHHEEDATLMIFDFGGGTLDVSIVDCFENVVEIIAVSGDSHLGGCDFDRAIADTFINKNGLDELHITEQDHAIILEAAVNAKKELSEKESTVMKATVDGSIYSMDLSRLDMIKLSENLFERMQIPVRKAMRDADIGENQLSAVVLVGGSCRMPVVQQYIKHILKGANVFIADPDCMVGLGAGVYAGIKERKEDIKDVILTDLCPFSLGVGAHMDNSDTEYNSVIIERNSPLPISKSQIYSACNPGQRYVKFVIYQGEEIIAENNINIGEIRCPIPYNPTECESVRVSFTYDINGILIVDAEVISSGEKYKKVIYKKDKGILIDNIDEKVKELEKIKINQYKNEENQLVIEKGNRLFAESTGRVREMIEKRLSYFMYILNCGNMYNIMRARKSVLNFFDYIEKNYINVSVVKENFSDWYEKQQISDEDKKDAREDEMLFSEWDNKYTS